MQGGHPDKETSMPQGTTGQKRNIDETMRETQNWVTVLLEQSTGEQGETGNTGGDVDINGLVLTYNKKAKAVRPHSPLEI